MFNVFAEAIVRKVPVVRKASVNVLREGAAVVADCSNAGTGYTLYAAVVVRTIRKLSRGFDSDRYVVNNLRREFEGRFEAAVVNRLEASRGMAGSPD
jgi:hypothetical protein